MSTYRLTDDDRNALSHVLLFLDFRRVVPVVEAIIAPIHARAEEAEARLAEKAALSDGAHREKSKRLDAAEKRADDLAAVVRSALAAWDSPGLTYGTTAKAFDDLRAALLPDDTKEADR